MSNIQVTHALPNRVRLKVPAVQNNEAVARRLEKHAKSVEGIHWVRANTLCAGIVVRFDAAMHTEADIVNLLSRHVAGGNA